jgi:chorismate mutase
VRRLEVVRGVLVEQEVSAIEYISLVITITQELLAEVIGKLNREAAGFQLVQWLLIAQGRWDDFSEVAMVGVHESFTNNSERQCTDFLAACEVLGVSLSVLLKLVDLIHPGEIAAHK